MSSVNTATGALPARVLAFYERFSREGLAAMSDLDAIYSPDVHFVNPVVDSRGIEEFRKVWRKAFRMYKVFECHDIVVSGNEEVFSLTYYMRIRFAIGPVFITEMMTECRARAGRITYCRDYFDPLGTLVSPIAPLRQLYRFVFRFLVA